MQYYTCVVLIKGKKMREKQKEIAKIKELQTTSNILESSQQCWMGKSITVSLFQFYAHFKCITMPYAWGIYA